jgi:uridine kinase
MGGGQAMKEATFEVTTMVELEAAVARILQQRATVPANRALLVGISGIDGSGKGVVTGQLAARLAQKGIAVATINADGWLNLPHRRIDAERPAGNFYNDAIRFEEMFARLVIPLRETRSACVQAQVAAETASELRPHTYLYQDVDVILVEGIFLFKRALRPLFDLAFWIDCSFATALERALTRRQEGLPPAATIRAYDTIYFPAQRLHFERDEPRHAADLVIVNDLDLAVSAKAHR